MNWPRYLSGVLVTLAAISIGIALEGDFRILWVPAAWIYPDGALRDVVEARGPTSWTPHAGQPPHRATGPARPRGT